MYLYKVYCKQRSEYMDHHTEIQNTEGVFREGGGGLQAQYLVFLYGEGGVGGCSVQLKFCKNSCGLQFERIE